MSVDRIGAGWSRIGTMRGEWRVLLVLLCACKAEIGGNPADPDGGLDANVDAADAMGTFGPWSAPMMLPGASTAGVNEDDGTLANNKLELIFSKADPAIDAGRKHLYWMSRTSVTATTWSTPVRLSINIDGTSDETPRFSADDKTLFFASNRTGTTGALDIWQSTRPTIGTAVGWTGPTLVGAINSAQTDKWCMPCSLGKYLMVSTRNTPATPSEDIYEGTTGGGAPALVTELSDLANTDNGPFISSDCRTMYFASNRSGAQRIYTSTRTSSSAPWPAPQPLPDFVAIGLAQEDPWISEDGRTFVFSATTTAGNKDVYITTR
jgi:Tol biopolymer transport system component